MRIVVINESLEVSDFELLVATSILHQRVQLNLKMILVSTSCMMFEKSLNGLIALEFILGQTQNFISLLFRNKAALDSQSLLCHLLPALVAELLH